MVFLFVILSGCTSALHVEIKENIVVEYGKELETKEFTDQKDVMIKEVSGFDCMKIGKQTINVLFEDKNGKESTEEIIVDVKDTKLPEIILYKDLVELTEGDAFDVKSNVKSVKDPVDGELKYSEKKDLNKEGYQIMGTIDVNKEGNYRINVIAFDKNGNRAEQAFTIKITKRKQEKVSENKVPNQPNVNSQGNSNQGGNVHNSGSENKSPENPQQCVSNGQYGRIGNSGKVFYSKQEMYDWAESVIFDENSPYYMMRYNCWTVYDNCGERKDVWTVDFTE